MSSIHSFKSLGGFLARCFAVMLVLGVSRASSQAQTDTAPSTQALQVSSAEELLTAYGVVILDAEEPSPDVAGSEGVSAHKPRVRRRKASIARGQSDHWDITVQLEAGDALPGSKIMAVAEDKNGHAVSSMVRWLVAPQAQASSDTVSCRTQRNLSRLSELQRLNEKELQDLVALRRRRKGVLAGLLKDIKVPVLFARLNAEEQKLGIARPKPLSEETPFEELLERLGAIDALLKHGN